jgi:hypothetical protein
MTQEGGIDQQLLLRNLGQAGLYGPYQAAQKSSLEQAKTLGELRKTQAETQRLGSQEQLDQAKVASEALPLVHQTLGAILQNPTQENYIAALTSLRRTLPSSLQHLVDQAPAQVDVGYLERAYRQTTDAKIALDSAKMQQERELALSGQDLTKRGQDITQRGQDITQRGQDIGRDTSLREYELKKAEIGEKRDTRVRGTEEQLRGELMKLGGDFRAQSEAYGRVHASASTPGAASAMSLVFSYMKLLDPGSTVREGEQASVRNATGIPERIRNIYNKAVSGDDISPAQRADILGQSERLYQQAEKDYQQKEQQYEKLTQRYGGDPSNVATDFRTTAPQRSRYNRLFQELKTAHPTSGDAEIDRYLSSKGVKKE